MATNIKYTQKQYDVILKPRNLIALDPYNGMNAQIRHQCLVCNNIWTTRPGVIRDGKECRHCYKLRVRKPLEVVKSQLSSLDWALADDSEYVNSYSRLRLIHSCGDIIAGTIDQLLSKSRRCLQCEPRILKNIWSNPVEVFGRKYYSNIERDCCEYLIDTYGIDDIMLHKKYFINSKKECDAYIKSKDLYIEISTINKDWYLERIYKKRQLVNNFVFVSSLDQLKLFC
jgi:hypothetical protein